MRVPCERHQEPRRVCLTGEMVQLHRRVGTSAVLVAAGRVPEPYELAIGPADRTARAGWEPTAPDGLVRQGTQGRVAAIHRTYSS